MSLLREFLEQAADGHCKKVLLDAIAEIQSEALGTVREFTFNRFNAHLIASTAMVEIDVSSEGQCAVTLDQLQEARIGSCHP